jgi:sugar phosphate isomerase/epimerase
LNRLETDLDAAIEDVQTLGARHLACPFLAEDRRRSGDDYRRVGEQLSEIGRKCRDAGLQLSYHNHAFEFEKFDGRYGLDILLETADPDLVKLELDLAWVVVAGEDAPAYLRRYAGRVALAHFKDLSTDPARKFAPVGSGKISFPELIAAAREIGVEWFIVEQDDPQPPAIDSVRQSVEFLRQQGVQ